MAEQQKGSEPKKENPTLSGSEPKPSNQPTAEEQAKALLAELGKVGVEKPEQIVNMVTASQQVGRVQNMLGDARTRIAQLEAELATAKAPRRQVESENINPNGESIDLAALIETKVEKGVRKVVQEMNEAQQRLYRENMLIRNDDDYGMVKDVYEQYMQSPEAQARLQAGDSLRDIYGDVKVKLLKEMVKRSRDVLTNLTNVSKPGNQSIPHVEGNETRSIVKNEPDDEKKEKLKNIIEARRTGRASSDAALNQLIEQLLPQNDPIWNTRR